jgi:hypothetical protein
MRGSVFVPALLLVLLSASGVASAGLVDVEPSGSAQADLLAVGADSAAAGCVALPGGLCVPGVAVTTNTVGPGCATGGVAIGLDCARSIFLSVSAGADGSISDDAAVSAFWGASSRLVALSGTGTATCDSPSVCLAASATGNATGQGGGEDVAISGCQVLTALGDSAECGQALLEMCVIVASDPTTCLLPQPPLP